MSLWTAGYKTPRGRRLRWVVVEAATEKEATRRADATFARVYGPAGGWRRYAGPLPIPPSEEPRDA